MSENQLIGGLLSEELEARAHAEAAQAQAQANMRRPKFGMPPSVAAHAFAEDHIRPTSAPPVVTSFDNPHAHVHNIPQYDVDSAEAFRADPAYCKWYYSQNPRDPRLPPPIVRPQPHAPHGSHPNAGVHHVSEEPPPPPPPHPHLQPPSAAMQQPHMQQPLQQPVPQQHMALTPLQAQHLADSAYQKGLVAMIQDDFPRTPSPVYGKELLAHAAALAAAQQTAALNMDMTQQGNADPAYLAQAMQSLSFQHNTPQVRVGPGLPPHDGHGGPMVPPMSYALATTSMSMPTMQSQGWIQPQPQPQGAGMSAPMMSHMTPQQQQLAMQTNQFYAQPTAYPQMMTQYGGMPMYSTDQQHAAYYSANPYELPHQPQIHVQHPNAQTQHGVDGSPLDKPKRAARRDRGHEDAPRTRLMEDFRSMKARRWEIQDLQGHMVEFSRDQEGSRLIQRKLESCSDPEKELVFAEVYKEALGLMTDVFGNYVIQKLFEHGLPRHRKMLACVLQGNVLSLTLQTYGCRVIQKALEVIDDEDQTMVAGELDGHVLRCVLDQNGNHVVQKCIERIPPENVIFIIQSFTGNVQNLAVHAYGCRVIQRILEYCEDHHEVISPILDEILDNVHVLARDQYGNYVVQHVLINGKPIYQAAIIERLRPDCMELAQHKFASNVVEKMFQYGTQDDRDAILNDLLRINADGTSALHVMMRDQYANYVVQKILDMADDGQRRLIIDHIKPHIATLRRYTYGKHIIARIEKLNSATGPGIVTGGKGGGPM